MMKFIGLLFGIMLSTISYAHEFEQGGYLCNPTVSYSACNEIAKVDAQHETKRLDGWYVSAATTWLGYPRSCVVAGSDTKFEFHAISNSNVLPNSNPWLAIIHNEPTYKAMMTRSKWGARIYEVIQRRGWLETPDFHEMTGDEVIALGVPRCN